jgi:hypothetical protein
MACWHGVLAIHEKGARYEKGAIHEKSPSDEGPFSYLEGTTGIEPA